MEEPAQNESGQRVLSIEEWRPKEPARVKEVRLTRRAGREARYEQVISEHRQGLTAKEIAQHLGLSGRTVQRWLAAGTFPAAKNDARSQVPLISLHPTCSNGGRRESETAWRYGVKS